MQPSGLDLAPCRITFATNWQRDGRVRFDKPYSQLSIVGTASTVLATIPIQEWPPRALQVSNFPCGDVKVRLACEHSSAVIDETAQFSSLIPSDLSVHFDLTAIPTLWLELDSPYESAHPRVMFEMKYATSGGSQDTAEINQISSGPAALPLIFPGSYNITLYAPYYTARAVAFEVRPESGQELRVSVPK